MPPTTPFGPIALAGALLAVSGCGTGNPAGGVTLLVTREYGARPVASAAPRELRGGETALSLVRRRLPVRLAAHRVQAVGGVSGAPGESWRLYVNGALTQRAQTRLRPGDRVWWDLHGDVAGGATRAVIGAFPQPFRSGVNGRRLPVVVACAREATAACREVERRLAQASVPVSRSFPGAARSQATLRVLVGPWRRVRADGVASRLEQGPAVSGVFARFEAGGRALVLLDRQGRGARRIGRGAGLVAALAPPGQAPTWVISGSDEAGTLHAARLLSGAGLTRRFAAVAQPGRAFSAPLGAPPTADRPSRRIGSLRRP